MATALLYVVALFSFKTSSKTGFLHYLKLLHLGEDRGGEVDDGVDARELLEQEDESAQDDALGGQQLAQARRLGRRASGLGRCMSHGWHHCVYTSWMHN